MIVAEYLIFSLLLSRAGYQQNERQSDELLQHTLTTRK